MAKKASKKPLHHKLEQPVHNLLGYGALLVLAVVVYMIVQGVQAANMGY